MANLSYKPRAKIPDVNTLRFDSTNTATPVNIVKPPTCWRVLAIPKCMIRLTVAVTPPESRINAKSAPTKMENNKIRVLPPLPATSTTRSSVVIGLNHNEDCGSVNNNNTSEENSAINKAAMTSFFQKTITIAKIGGMIDNQSIMNPMC